MTEENQLAKGKHQETDILKKIGLLNAWSKSGF